ncbi:unnamed protein product [Acanthoscelides obtectus]|uniref:Uncharacterized protein n=1 Tax=Acanthoscelides obtectus TaxID=200917 RepID=A0A9P0KGM4_ACAOB|nr:unnamed protein product [Acanthoscelides obtectus]CAK1669287.1 hypothetical protein AOBTE_LOCUS26928 [Acanthoscelides obtectus]
MFKVTLQGHSETQGQTSRSHFKVTLRGHSKNSRSHFKVTRKLQVTFQCYISSMAPKVSSQGRLAPKVGAQGRPRTYKPYPLIRYVAFTFPTDPFCDFLVRIPLYMVIIC